MNMTVRFNPQYSAAQRDLSEKQNIGFTGVKDVAQNLGKAIINAQDHIAYEKEPKLAEEALKSMKTHIKKAVSDEEFPLFLDNFTKVSEEEQITYEAGKRYMHCPLKELPSEHSHILSWINNTFLKAKLGGFSLFAHELYDADRKSTGLHKTREKTAEFTHYISPKLELHEIGTLHNLLKKEK